MTVPTVLDGWRSYLDGLRKQSAAIEREMERALHQICEIRRQELRVARANQALRNEVAKLDGEAR